jgi:hypothetical protein
VGVLITSGNRLGLRAQGGGGRTALSSYDQIVRTLAQSMDAEHVALFAEPSLRGAAIDWFTNFDATAAPMPLNAADPSTREAARARLESLVNDISAKAAGLQQSGQEGDRILGEMLQYALDIPSEDAVWLVGDQPVLTFWGHVRDQGQPAENPLRTLIQKRPVSKAPVAPTAGKSDIGAAKAQTAAPLGGRSYLPAALWAIFTLLLVALGLTLLHACGLGWTGAFLNYCPVTVDLRIDRERELQSALKAEYDDIVRQTELKRQACLLQPPPKPLVPTPKPEPTPTPRVDPNPRKDDTLVIPPPNQDKQKEFDFLKGCWHSDHGMTELIDGKDTGKPITQTYCFGEGGQGTETIKYDREEKTCRGAVRARRQGAVLTLDIDRADCDDKTFYNPQTAVCRPGDDGGAICDETPVGETEPTVKDFRFLKN